MVGFNCPKLDLSMHMFGPHNSAYAVNLAYDRHTDIYIYIRVSSRIFCLGGKNSLESLTTPTFVGTLYWHVIDLFCTTLGY